MQRLLDEITNLILSCPTKTDVPKVSGKICETLANALNAYTEPATEKLVLNNRFHCPECKTHLLAVDNFCPNCGRKVKNES